MHGIVAAVVVIWCFCFLYTADGGVHCNDIIVIVVTTYGVVFAVADVVVTNYRCMRCCCYRCHL